MSVTPDSTPTFGKAIRSLCTVIDRTEGVLDPQLHEHLRTVLKFLVAIERDSETGHGCSTGKGDC